LFDRPVAPILTSLASRGILGGLDLSDSFPELGHALLVCATETKTLSDINSYVTALGDAMQSAVRAA
jgi:glycine dehydrogenase subunit 1